MGDHSAAGKAGGRFTPPDSTRKDQARRRSGQAGKRISNSSSGSPGGDAEPGSGGKRRSSFRRPPSTAGAELRDLDLGRTAPRDLWPAEGAKDRDKDGKLRRPDAGRRSSGTASPGPHEPRRVASGSPADDAALDWESSEDSESAAEPDTPIASLPAHPPPSSSPSSSAALRHRRSSSLPDQPPVLPPPPDSAADRRAAEEEAERRAREEVLQRERDRELADRARQRADDEAAAAAASVQARSAAREHEAQRARDAEREQAAARAPAGEEATRRSSGSKHSKHGHEEPHNERRKGSKKEGQREGPSRSKGLRQSRSIDDLQMAAVQPRDKKVIARASVAPAPAPAAATLAPAPAPAPPPAPAPALSTPAPSPAPPAEHPSVSTGPAAVSSPRLSPRPPAAEPEAPPSAPPPSPAPAAALAAAASPREREAPASPAPEPRKGSAPAPSFASVLSPRPGSASAGASPVQERSKIRALFSAMIGGKASDPASPSPAKAGHNPYQFGVALEELAARSKQDVPPVLTACVAALQPHLATEGLFRMSAAVAEVAELKALCERGLLDSLAPAAASSPHTVACLLSQLLMDLPEPLFTFALYEDFVAAAALPDGPSRTSAVAALVARMPRAYGATLRALVGLLQAVERQSAVNKMGAANLGIVFGPIALRPRREVLDLRKLQLQNALLEFLARAPFDDLFPPAPSPASTRLTADPPKSHRSPRVEPASARTPGAGHAPPQGSRRGSVARAVAWDEELSARDWQLLLTGARAVQLRRDDPWPPPGAAGRLPLARVKSGELQGPAPARALFGPDALLGAPQLFDPSLEPPRPVRCASEAAELLLPDLALVGALLDSDDRLAARFGRHFALRFARQYAATVAAKRGVAPDAAGAGAEHALGPPVLTDHDQLLRAHFGLPEGLAVREYAAVKQAATPRPGTLLLSARHWCFYNPRVSATGKRGHAHPYAAVERLERDPAAGRVVLRCSTGKTYTFAFEPDAYPDAFMLLSRLCGCPGSQVPADGHRFAKLLSADLGIMFAQAMSPADWTLVHGACSSSRVSKGEVIMHEGKKQAKLWLVGSGSCRMVVHKPSGEAVLLGSLDTGERFGDVEWLLGGVAALQSVISDEPMEIKTLPVAGLTELFSKAPAFVSRFYLQLITDLLTRISRCESAGKSSSY